MQLWYFHISSFEYQSKCVTEYFVFEVADNEILWISKENELYVSYQIFGGKHDVWPGKINCAVDVVLKENLWTRLTIVVLV